MKLKLIGWVHNKGRGVNQSSGEVFEFDSFTLDCATPMSVRGQNVSGQGGLHYRKVKFKSADFDVIFGGAITPGELTDWCGKWIAVDGMGYNTSNGSYIAAEEIHLVDEE